jgi:hypothetical protein
LTPEIIYLHRDAPTKPDEGAPCNGCGVCCALETCPAGRLRFLQRRGPCPALEWHATDRRYHCGMLARPTHYLPGLPAGLAPAARRVLARSIAAGAGCDCDVTVDA